MALFIFITLDFDFLFYSKHKYYSFVHSFILDGLFGCGNVVVFAIIKEQFPLEITGTAQSIVNVFPFVGAAIFQTFLGYILDIVGDLKAFIQLKLIAWHSNLSLHV